MMPAPATLQLHVSAPMFGMPRPSPFETKAEVLLKMSGVPFSVAPMDYRKAPKGKTPYLTDGATTLGDSYFIRRHLETKYGADFSGGYAADALAQAWAVERMLEEHLYFLVVYERWVDTANFNKGPRHYFDDAPAPLRAILPIVIRRKVKKMLTAQGLGRHAADERFELGKGDVDAVSVLLGDKRYLLGDRACGTDATVFAFLLTASAPYFDTRLGPYVRDRSNIMAYLERLRTQFYPALAKA